jgi:hypothetical protein
MVTTNFPNGITSWGVPLLGPGSGSGAGSLPIINSGGSYWFVSSVVGNNGFPGTFDQPFATLAFAVNATTGNTKLASGDVIVLLPGHAETVTTAGGITLATAGVRIVGIGNADGRPTFTFGTNATASFLISAANCSVDNIVGKTSLATTLQNPIDVTGNDFAITNFNWEDATGFEAIHVIRAVAVDDLTIQLRHQGLYNGSASTSPIYLNGCSEVEISIDYYGLSSVAVVNFYTNPCLGVRVSGQAYVYGITNSSRLVVDSATGSQWWAEIMDGGAGYFVAGGSATTFAPAGGGTAVANALYAASPSGVPTWPTAHAYGNGYSIASVLGYVQDAVRNGSGAALATNKSLVDALGTDGTTVTGAAGSVINTLGTNASSGGTFSSSAVTSNRTGSILGRLADVIDQAEKTVATTSATMLAATDTIFTIAGGPIQVIEILGIFNTVNTGAASTFAGQINATAGGVTALSIASASTSGAAAGTALVLPAAAGSAITAVAGGAHAQLLPAWIAPVGTIQMVVGGAGTVGQVQWFLRYKPLAPGVTVTAGY